MRNTLILPALPRFALVLVCVQSSRTKPALCIHDLETTSIKKEILTVMSEDSELHNAESFVHAPFLI